MSRWRNGESTCEYFSAKYAQRQTDATRRVERMVLGHEVGLSGYTTVDEARSLCSRMEVASGARVLDLGSGRGWPGSFLARCMGCRLVFCDLPIGALHEAMERFHRPGDGARATALAADGMALPFGPARFGAVVHADVFCWIEDKLSVLRALHEVLEPGGSIGGYSIHTPPGLTASERALASELGPTSVTASASPPELAAEAGFVDVRTFDVTAAFAETCAALLGARTELEAELRAEEGDDGFEEEQAKKSRMLEGIDEGLLRRSLVIARKER